MRRDRHVVPTLSDGPCAVDAARRTVEPALVGRGAVPCGPGRRGHGIRHEVWIRADGVDARPVRGPMKGAG